jgi:protein TonB
MESKKNPKSDVRRNSSIFFAVGLALMLLIANYAINYRSHDKETAKLAVLSLPQLDEVDIPITDPPVTPPPVVPPPIIPDDFDIRDDDDDIIENMIDLPEFDPDEPIIDIENVIVDEPEEDVEIPYVLIEDVPVFPGCEKGTSNERRACMSDKIRKHVQKKFNVNLAEDLGLTGKQKISVIFKINKNGDIVDVQSRAPHPRLEAEAARVIHLLPKMKPGKQGGKAVTVKYALPIMFQVQN